MRFDATGAVRAALVESLKAVQESSEGSCPPLTDLTVPFKDLKGFESYRGVEVAAEISIRLGALVEEIDYVDPLTRKTRSVGEIVVILTKRIGSALSVIHESANFEKSA